MKNILLLSTIFCATIGYSQTKSIAYKRHNNSRNHLSMAFMEPNSNLGAAPEKWVRNSELKKVIFINDTTQAMVTEDKCVDLYKNSPSSQWRAGTDTVQKHPVFSSGISVDSMRTILKAEYYFANDMKEVEFVDFEKRDEVQSQEIQNEKAKTSTRKEKRSQKSALGKYWWLLLVVGSSLGIGIINIR